jgi:hypothetical protein
MTSTRWQLVAGLGRHNGDAALIAALAGGATVQQAATMAHLGERTAYRRLAEPAFRRQVDRGRDESIARAVGQLAEASTEAVATLRALLSAESASVRLGACRAILELGMKLRENHELATRLAALEEQQEAE